MDLAYWPLPPHICFVMGAGLKLYLCIAFYIYLTYIVLDILRILFICIKLPISSRIISYLSTSVYHEDMLQSWVSLQLYLDKQIHNCTRKLQTQQTHRYIKFDLPTSNFRTLSLSTVHTFQHFILQALRSTQGERVISLVPKVETPSVNVSDFWNCKL